VEIHLVCNAVIQSCFKIMFLGRRLQLTSLAERFYFTDRQNIDSCSIFGKEW